MTSGTLVIKFLHLLHFIFTSSIKGLCKSISFFIPDKSFNSLMLPTIISFLHLSHLHIGKGVPQNFFLDKAQSFAPSNQFPNLPSLICSGTQIIFLLFFNNSFL